MATGAAAINLIREIPIKALELGVLGTLLLLLAAACGASATPTSAPMLTPAPTSASALQPASLGEQLFVSKGCAACHGEEGKGSEIAPALPGHTETQVRRQVRAPMGLMPVFPPDRVSSQELARIAEYITSLSGPHGHMAPVNLADSIAQHHWMALFALKDEAQDEAIHHISHIIELVEGDHLARMRESLRTVEAGNLHDAEHIIEDMLAGTASPGLDEKEVHLRLAITSVKVEDPGDATHHLEHFLDLVEGDSKEAGIGVEIMDLLGAGDLSEAEHHISELTEAVSDEDLGHHDEEPEGIPQP